MGLLEQGLILTLAGMAIVFVFLTILILLIRVAAATIALTTPKAPAIEQEPVRDDGARIAAAIAAARAFAQSNQRT